MTAPSAVDVVGLGESSIDFVYRIPHLPIGGGAKMPILAGAVLAGGQVATTLCTCAALGLRTRYLGVFGDDDHGSRIRAALSRRGVDVGCAFIRPGTSRYAVILVDDASGDRVVLWRKDPALALRPEDVRPETIERARLLHVDATDEAASIAAAKIARAAGLQVTSDIDRATPATRELVAEVTVPIFAAGVAEALTGTTDVRDALRRLRQTHSGWLCATLGADGAVLLAGDTLHEVSGRRVAAVDTTGAGDVFRGAFIAAMLRGDPPGDVLRFAAAAAAVSCTRTGAIDSVPTRQEIEALLAGPS